MNLNDLPGAEIILPGLTDLQNGESQTIGALLVAIAATRLTEAGLDVPRHHLASEPELTLYARLQNEQDDAYQPTFRTEKKNKENKKSPYDKR